MLASYPGLAWVRGYTLAWWMVAYTLHCMVLWADAYGPFTTQYFSLRVQPQPQSQKALLSAHEDRPLVHSTWNGEKSTSMQTFHSRLCLTAPKLRETKSGTESLGLRLVSMNNVYHTSPISCHMWSLTLTSILICQCVSVSDLLRLAPMTHVAWFLSLIIWLAIVPTPLAMLHLLWGMCVMVHHKERVCLTENLIVHRYTYTQGGHTHVTHSTSNSNQRGTKSLESTQTPLTHHQGTVWAEPLAFGSHLPVSASPCQEPACPAAPKVSNSTALYTILYHLVSYS